MSRWTHYGHLSKILVNQGQYVKRGTLIGYIGSSGQSSGPHLHVEIMREKPKTWHQYVHGLAYHQVKWLYEDPNPYIKDGVPAENSFPHAGYGYLQYVRNGNYWHPGVDVNGINDLGKPVYALFNGRTQFVEGLTPIKNWLGKITGYSDWNGGWGNHIWQEVDEVDPGIKI